MVLSRSPLNTNNSWSIKNYHLTRRHGRYSEVIVNIYQTNVPLIEELTNFHLEIIQLVHIASQ